jgi:hypothetical protein
VKKIHIEKLHNLCLSPDISIVIKSRNETWEGHKAPKGEVRENFSWEKTDEALWQI